MLNGVVQFDLVDEGYEGFNKFIPYYLFPEATYTVALTRGSKRTKISVGSNPGRPSSASSQHRDNLRTLWRRRSRGRRRYFICAGRS